MTRVDDRQERLIESRVTYTLELDGRFLLVENVPARVNVETGERFFAPRTVERLQRMIRGKEAPVRTVETPVYQFTA